MTAVMRTAPSAQPKADLVLAKALLRAADLLDLSQKDLARVLGVSAATMSRLATSGRRLDPRTKEGELALLFLRLFRSLDALVGGKDGAARQWLHAKNAHVGGVPAALIQSVEGLVHVTQYLDAMRGKL